jgi:uncharacterized protein YkwD
MFFNILFILIAFFGQLCLAGDLYQEVEFKINNIRKNYQLKELKINKKLNFAAKSQSDWMSATRKMSHLRSNKPNSFEEYKSCDYHPVNRVINAGYYGFDELFDVAYHSKGISVNPKPISQTNVDEIVAMGKAGNQAYNTNIIVTGWMNSPGHRKAILSPVYKEMGIGISSPEYGEVYWCVVFATR